MYTHKFKFKLSNYAVVLFFCSLVFTFSAKASNDKNAADIIDLSGRVEQRLSQGSWQPAKVNDSLSDGDEIQTWEGKATLLMSDESMVKLNRNSYMRLQTVSQTASWRRTSNIAPASSSVLQSIYQLLKGEAWIRNNNRDLDIEIQTPTVTASLRGTEINIQIVSPELVNIAVLEGALEASNSVGSVRAVAGEVVIAALGQVPRKQTLLSPADSVQWTVRVPNIIDSASWSEQSGISAQQLNDVLADLEIQDVIAAQQKIAQLDTNTAQGELLNALVDLSTGEHQQAYQRFFKLTKSKPNNAVSWRGLALSSLLINQKQNSIAAATRATEVQPDNATNWLLLAYAQRAKFDLDTAQQSILKALNLSPNSTLALTELALLQFANDDLQEAQQTIQKALATDNNDSLANSLAGFIEFSQRQHQNAQQSFVRASQLNPQNSEAYLGLSLIAQRQGDSTTAQQQLARAIALEPQRSLYLSYWAKSLHQERRFNKALTVLESASRLDPQDPTPHFYRSIIERDLFTAGEAINSLQTAIELNDQRAVYRSRLLLDQDLASRNINLASIYGGLGLNTLATQKAVQSSLSDFRNFSAHLFLSSALSNAGRTFPAGSEILVTNLMLPTNANALSSINDYATFFEGPETDAGVTLGFGNNNSYSASAFLGAIKPSQNLYYGFNASTNKTDGWSGNNGFEQSSFAGQLKWQPSQRDSVYANLSAGDTERVGGSFNRFSIDFLAQDERSNGNDLLLDLGYRRELSPSSDLLVNINLRQVENDVQSLGLIPSDDGEFLFSIDELTESLRRTNLLQAQFSQALGKHQLFIGSVLLDGRQTQDYSQTSFLADLSGSRLSIPAEIRQLLDENDQAVNEALDTRIDLSFRSFYVDDIWQLSEQLSLQFGAYFEDFDNGTTNESELNPRLAAVWQANANNTFRLAAFRYLLPQVISRLHPTHVGGVFITRNTEEGALVEELNLVWERNWRSGIFTLNAFDLERDNRETRGGVSSNQQSTLRGISLALNQQIGNRFGLSTALSASEVRDDFSLLQFERDEFNAGISLTYVSPKRISASVTQSFRHIDFVDAQRANESIPLTDIALAYTFANRRGSISATITNLFDEEFNWLTDAFSITGRNPAREYGLSVSFNF